MARVGLRILSNLCDKRCVRVRCRVTADALATDDMAGTDVYAAPIGPALGSPKAYAITDDYYKTADADARARVALAGARLANLLTTALK